MIKKILLINMFIVLVLYTQSYAEFIGPSDVLSITYGSGNGQVGLQHGDTEDSFPSCFEVSPSGRIAICDIVNDRVVIFKADGSFERNINILTLSMKFDLQENLILSAKLQKYDNNGQLLWIKTEGFHDVEVVSDKIIGYNMDTKTYSLYSPTGALIRTTTDRPLELGKVKEKKTAAGYTYTVQYPDIVNPNITKTYTVSVARPAKIVTRDKSGNLYITTTSEREFEDDTGVYWSGNDIVYRFDTQNTLTATMQIPDSQIGPEEFDGEYSSELIVGYGEPVISPNGDVYTWKRTQTTYSIIKWTWKP